MSDRLFVAWQDETTRAWHTIARLTRMSTGTFELVFTKGAERLGPITKNLFRMDPRHRYNFDDLIPLFTNRIPPRTRSDFQRISDWLDVDSSGSDFDLLAKFGLIPGTDSVLVYPEPEIQEGKLLLDFFVHGIRHMHKDVLTWCDKLEIGTRLLPLLDVQNPVDRFAVALRSEEDTILVGYIPTFYAEHVGRILLDTTLSQTARITVKKNNKDAPIQLRLLCRFEADVPADFSYLQSAVHQPIS